MRNEDLPSLLPAVFTLVAVLFGSFLLASRYLTRDEVDAAPPPVAERDCLAPDGCRKASPELRAAYNNPNACSGVLQRVCLVPMGDVPLETIEMLVAYYRREYGLRVQVAAPLDLREGFDRRTQMEESIVAMQLRSSYSEYANDRSVTLIGIVPVDLYQAGLPGTEWTFGRLQGVARPGTPTGVDYIGGVISIFRMDPVNSGLPADDVLRDTRIRKMVNKFIALGHYELPVSNDPRSITYGFVASLADLDRAEERIPLP